MIDFTASKRVRSGPNVASLIDVIFLLLIFFMLTFGAQDQAMDLSLPQGPPSEAKQEQELIVHLRQDKTVLVNHQPIKINSLSQELETRLKHQKSKSVVIEVEKKIPYGFFANVLDLARQAGAKDFSIVK